MAFPTVLARRARRLLLVLMTLLGALSLAACALSGGSGQSTVVVTATAPQATVAATVTAAATATPIPECVSLAHGSKPYTSIGITGLSLPTGAYITSPAYSGGGSGLYRIATYTACFHGSEPAIDGFSSSTLSQLKASGWALNNLFPDTGNFTRLDYCSNSHNCVNSKGTPNPFTFIGFSHYTAATNGYTLFTLQVATIAKPVCLNDIAYYSGTPKYTLYYDGNSASSSGTPQDHFQMPPATRVSTFQGGGTAGSTYVYFCSAGSAAHVVAALKSAMAATGWAISAVTASSFTATYSSGLYHYQIDVSVPGPNNYVLRVFIPM
jgi:hypothetical protein